MNQKRAKFLRKKAEMFNLPYKQVKRAFNKLTLEKREKFMEKWMAKV